MSALHELAPQLDSAPNFRLSQLRHEILQCPVEDVEHFPLKDGWGGAIVPLGIPITNEKIVTFGIPEVSNDPARVEKATGFKRRFWREGDYGRRNGETIQEHRERIRDELLVPAGELVARETFQAVGRKPEDVDVLIVLTTAGPYGLAEALRKRIGLVNVPDENLFTVAMTCPSGAAGLDIAGRLPANLRKLILAPEILTILIDKEHDPDGILFSDVGSGLYDEGAIRVVGSSHKPYPEKASALQISPLYGWPENWDPSQVFQQSGNEWRSFYPQPPGEKHLCMNGEPVFRWSVDEVTEHILEHAKANEIDPIDLNSVTIVPHQANGRIITAQERKIKRVYPNAQFAFVNENLGNNSAGSTTGAILKARERGLLKSAVKDSEGRSRVLAVSYGGGLVSWVTDLYIPV